LLLCMVCWFFPTHPSILVSCLSSSWTESLLSSYTLHNPSITPSSLIILWILSRLVLSMFVASLSCLYSEITNISSCSHRSSFFVAFVVLFFISTKGVCIPLIPFVSTNWTVDKLAKVLPHRLHAIPYWNNWIL
jgi:hypothetical protein